jgi:sterol desaturase/sphingolipid hydroxylase (fatty acid hydroxylase superfamily)
VHLPVIDRLLGTYHMPREQWPDAYGIADRPVPQRHVRQLTYPFVGR